MAPLKPKKAKRIRYSNATRRAAQALRSYRRVLEEGIVLLLTVHLIYSGARLLFCGRAP